MDFSVDRCWRRPASRTLLVYLDTSTFARLAGGAAKAASLARALTEMIESEAGVCVASPWHDDEIALIGPGPRLDQLVRTMRTYTLDVRMRYKDELIDRELIAAAKAFSGEAIETRWPEAFQDDPEDPPLKPFQAEYLNRRGRPEYPPAAVDEVDHERETSQLLATAHAELRGAGLEWETVAEANLEKQVEYLLGPLARPEEFASEYDARTKGLARTWMREGADMDAGSATRKYLRFAHLASMGDRLRERYPAVAASPAGFCESDAVRYLPAIRLFPFLLAALSVDGRQTTPQNSDLHDMWHLTYGLSRCDVVTADQRSCALAVGRNLVPRGVTLLEAHRLDEIADAVTRKASRSKR